MTKARYLHQVSICWRNPYTSPPPGTDTMEGRYIWAATCLPGTDYRALASDCAPPFVPGEGWCLSITTVNQTPPTRWTPEAKARVRQRNLRKRIETRAPLFAEELIAREIAARPDYFDPEAIAGAEGHD